MLRRRQRTTYRKDGRAQCIPTLRGLCSTMNKAVPVDSPSRSSDRKLKLSAIQQAVLHWLRREQRRRPQVAGGHGIPYPEVAQALGVDRAELSACLRRLIRKRLVVAKLPRGSWVRYIALTDKAEANPPQNTPKEPRKHRDPRSRWEREPQRPRRKSKSRRRERWTPLTELDG